MQVCGLDSDIYSYRYTTSDKDVAKKIIKLPWKPQILRENNLFPNQSSESRLCTGSK
jgi:hypothetical protein